MYVLYPIYMYIKISKIFLRADLKWFKYIHYFKYIVKRKRSENKYGYNI